ncbi:porin family protein [Fulvivirgaceae bacterium BMA10]|uniref:Porin family protein n=1 Tax=Splendidivirga corallicola TaxID=3051826 RepID=A0ABT8KXM4_9BACT|nr:porin family protein [Fulvivirgaceae bacterium BMA10]
MKTVSLTLTVSMLIFTHLLVAQDLKVGAKGGLNVSSFGGDFIDVKSRAGFHLGGYGNLEFDERVNFQGELLYSLQGVKIKGEDIRSNLSYIILPVLVQVKLPEVTEGFTAYSGPQFGFLLSAKQKGSFNGNEVDRDIKDDIKGFDLSWIFGIGYALESGVDFGIRYNIGLNDINAQTDEDAGAKATNQVFQIWIGYLLWSQ